MNNENALIKKFKKGAIFLVILAIIFSAVYIFPYSKILENYNKENEFKTLGNSNIEYWQAYNKIMNSDIDEEYKKEVLKIVVDGNQFANNQRNTYLIVIAYAMSIINIVLLITSICIIKFTSKKVWGISILITTILSIAFLIFAVYIFSSAILM